MPEQTAMKTHNIKILIRNLVIEMVVYALLLVGYFYAVLRFLGDFLTQLFRDQLVVYGFLGLVLIVAQALILELLTSYFIRLLRLDSVI
jgi:hypothetical protein